ncbi:MAG: PAS domain S-box protein [Xanthobacteraceae bacterium]
MKARRAADRGVFAGPTILNAMRVGIYCVDAEGRCTFINDAALELTGYKHDEIIGQNMHDLIHHTYPDGSAYPQSACPLMNTLKSGHAVQLDNETLWRKDGSFFTAEYSSYPILDADVVVGSVINFQDNAQRGQARRRLGLQITVSRILAGSADVKTASSQVLAAIGSGLGWQAGAFWILDGREGSLRASAVWAEPSLEATAFLADTSRMSFKWGTGLPGRVLESGAPEQVDDLASDPNIPSRASALGVGLRHAFAFPVKVGRHTLGVIEIFGRDLARFDDDLLDSVGMLGQQIGQFVRRKRTEEELRGSEALKGAILQAALDCVITITDQSEVIEWNPAAERTFGYPRQAVLGRSLIELIIPPEFRQQHCDGMARYLATGEGRVLGKRVELEALRADGSRFPIELAINTIETNGRPLFTAYLRDITQRKRGESALRESEGRLRTLANAIPQLAWMTDAEGSSIWYNKRWYEYTGTTFEEMKGWGWRKVQHPDHTERVVEHFKRSVEAGEFWEDTFPLRGQGGEYRWFLSRAVPMREDGGRIWGWFGTNTDVTEQRRTEEALREAEERYRLAARATNDAIWDWDLLADRIQWNEAVQSLFGYGEDHAETPGDWWKNQIHSEDRARVVAGISAIVDGAGTHWSEEYRFRKADGRYATVLDRGFLLRDERQRPLRMIGAMQDITDRKRFEHELAAAKEAAEEANRAKSQFIANMSHELRTPLTAVIGYSEMLEEEAEDLGQATMLEDLRKIESNARHLLSLINDVLDISKIEAGKMEVHLDRFDVADLIEDVANTVQALLAKKNNELIIEKGGELGAMHSDVVKLRQCLFNLLSNAAKFTQDGRITLSARRTADSEPQLIFQVKDTGIGMTAELLGRLFQRFSQADASTTRKFGGTGLGLALTRALCRTLGGDISVESEAGRGSTFTIRLPVDLSRTGAKSADRDERTEEDAPGKQGVGDTVLVIDDDPHARELLSRFLHREGFAVRVAADGEAGLALARAVAPCAILLDVMMPRLDGWSVLSALKADPELTNIPVIMVTIVQERTLGFSLGAADYLTKPVDWLRLKALLERYRCSTPSPRLLLVSEDENTRTLLRDHVAQEGWTIVSVRDTGDALDRLGHDPPDLALVDLQHENGFHNIRDLKRRDGWRDTPIVVLVPHDFKAEDKEKLRGQVGQVIEKDGDVLEELNTVLRRVACRPPAPSYARQGHGDFNGQDPAG